MLITNRFKSALSATAPLLIPITIAALLPAKPAKALELQSAPANTCWAEKVTISISARMATIDCGGNRKLKRNIIAGNPKATKVVDRTPLGRFIVSEVVSGTEVGYDNYMAGAAKFAVEPGRSEVGYYIHGLVPGVTGYKSRYSIGCIRMSMVGVTFMDTQYYGSRATVVTIGS
jgi:L,D-transpeptidase catalytic domain